MGAAHDWLYSVRNQSESLNLELVLIIAILVAQVHRDDVLDLGKGESSNDR